MDPMHYGGQTLVVNLEPCNHQGRTPPCTQSIVRAGIAHVIVGMRDPNPIAAGGIGRLRDEDIQVTTDVLQSQCYRFNEAFAHWQQKQTPLVTVKIAQTLDGCIATTTGESQWITGEASRERVHLWRREQDAILVGSGTARADNPSLTLRYVTGNQPRRIVFDAKANLPSSLNLFADEWAHKTIAVIGEGTMPSYADLLQDRGGHLIATRTESGHFDLPELFRSFGDEYGIRSILVEAGPGLATALFRENQVDRLQLFIAPRLIGNGLRGIGDLSVRKLVNSITFQEHSWEEIGRDQLFTGYSHPIPDHGPVHGA